MKSSNKEITINHNAKQLFNIVLDLEKYPEFIPWCIDMRIHSNKANEIFADMYVLYKLLLPQKFGSHVIFNVKKLNIKTIYIDGPLKDLKTDWQFNPISRSKTIVNFSVHFEFKRFLHQKLAEIFYPLIENKMIESFKQRANQILK
jgi:coenzyme Q-binding protein COQ10